MGLLTSIFFLLRILLFRFHESPRFLVSVGKYEQAQEILQILAAKNGVQLPTLEIMDFSSTSTHACTSKIVSTDLEGNTQHHYSQEQHQQHPHPHQFKSVSSYSIINHLKPLFSGGLFKITILLWLIWILLAIGYNIFNGFLPKLLMENSVELSYQDTYRNVFIITSCGVPGCIFSTFLAGSRTGKRNPMAISSLLAAGAMLVFTLIKSSDGQLIASCVASVFQNLFFSLLYAYTPEVYPPSVRGIGFGAASALNRLFGCLAPLIGGFMLNFELALPIQISAATIALATVFMFFLPRDST